MVLATTRKCFGEQKISAAEEALDILGANFEVQTVGLVTESGADVPMKKGVIRTDTNQVLGVVGNKYTPIQNSTAFAFFDTICKSTKATYEYGFLIDGGRQVVLQARIGADWEARKGDVVSNYITLINSHDGSLPHKAFFTPRRLFCMNQLRAALKSAVSEISIRHTSRADSKMVDALAILNCAAEYFVEFKQTSQLLAQKIVDQKMINDFIESVFDDTESKNKNKQSAIETVEMLFNSGKGNRGESAWDLYNGLTEYTDHYRYNHKADAEALNAASALLTGADLKEKAWDFVTSLI